MEHSAQPAYDEQPEGGGRAMNMLVAWLVCSLGYAFAKWVLRPCQPSITLPPPPTTVDHTARADDNEAELARAPKTGLRYLVVGTGSVGTCIVEALLARGEEHVRGFDIAPNTALDELEVETVKGSVTQLADLTAACQGIDVVYATFALIRFYERLRFQYTASHAVNVVGTANLIAACKAAGVRVLVVTSTSNVCVSPSWCPTWPVKALTEDTPLVDHTTSPSHYGWTKVQAEKLVLAAHHPSSSSSGSGLAAGCIRPCSAIFGPSDNFITQKWLDAGAIELLTPEPTIDYVYVENVVWGHLLLERALLDAPAKVGGKAYCISNEEPVTGGDFYAKLCYFYQATTGLKLKVNYMPSRLLYGLSFVLEAVQWITRGALKGEAAQLTPAMFHTAYCSYTFSSARSRDELGYRPLFSLDEGLQRTVASWHGKQRSVSMMTEGRPTTSPNEKPS